MEFICPLCSHTLFDLFRLHVHCMKAHPNDFYTCPWCTQPFGSRQGLQKHSHSCEAFDRNELREGEIDRVYVRENQCLECGSIFASGDEAIAHYKLQHLRFNYICDVCEQFFVQSTALNLHYTASHSHMQSTSTSRSTSSILSIFNGHPKRNKYFLAKATGAEKRHIMKSFNENYCTGCRMRFESAEEITRHFETEHTTKVFRCDVCNRAYLSPQACYTHCNRNAENPSHMMMKNETATLEKRSDNHQKQRRVFCCQFCAHQTKSLDSHIREEHPRPESMIGVPSTSTNINRIKEEPMENMAPRHNPRLDPDIMDLTLDSDSDSD